MLKKLKKRNALGIERAHIFYSGRVQGVGFRYTAEGVAMDLGLTGWVKNLPDDRVEVVCEGPREKIENFLRQIRESALGPKIQKTDCRWETPTAEFNDFHVEFWS